MSLLKAKMGKIVYVPVCHSTNDQVQNYGKDTTVWTTHQTHGRGQRGNSWEGEPEKNLAMSYLTNNINLNAKLSFFLNIVTGLALSDSLSSLVAGVRVKWPNDILVFDNKIAGILIETSLSGGHIAEAVVGIGLNVNEIPSHASRTSLKKETGKDFDIEKIMHLVNHCLMQRLEELSRGEFTKLKADYYANLYRFHETSVFETDKGEVFEGVIVGTTSEGRLAVSDGCKIRNFALKEVSFIK